MSLANSKPRRHREYLFPASAHDQAKKLTYSHVARLQVGQADIVVAAIGVPLFVKGSWLKPGAVVIDVGTNFVSGTKVPLLAFCEYGPDPCVSHQTLPKSRDRDS